MPKERPDNGLLPLDAKGTQDSILKNFDRWSEEGWKVFRKENNAHAHYPTKNSDEFARLFHASPAKSQLLSRSVLTRVRTIENSKRMLDAHRQYHAMQIGTLITTGLLLPGGRNAPTTFQIEGSPGSGKTVILADLADACLNLQRRGLFGKVGYLTDRNYVLHQQLQNQRSRAMSLRHLRTTNDQGGREEWNYIVKSVLPGGASLSLKEFQSLLGDGTETDLKAVERMKDALGGKHPWARDTSDALEEVAMLAARRGALINDEFGKVVLEKLPPIESDENVGEIFTGDFGRIITPDMLEGGAVVTGQGVDVSACSSRKRTPEDIERETRAKLWVFLKSRLTNTNTLPQVAHIFAGTEAVFLDETGKNPGSRWQDAIEEANTISGKRNAARPFVFSASGLRFTSSDMRIPRFERYTPSQTIAQSINALVLPSVGVDMWPQVHETHYPSESQEAIDQLVQEFFNHFPLAEEMDLPPPHLCKGIVALHPKVVPAVMARFRKEYAKRKIPCKLYSLETNMKFPYTGRVMDLMSEDEEEDGKAVVKLLFSRPAFITTALDLPNIRCVTVGTKHGISRESLGGILGRLEHSNLHRDPSSGKSFRGYFLQQRFSDQDGYANIFRTLSEQTKIPTQGRFSFVPLHAALSNRMYDHDEAVIGGNRKGKFEARTVSAAPRKDVPVPVGLGRPMSGVPTASPGKGGRPRKEESTTSKPANVKYMPPRTLDRQMEPIPTVHLPLGGALTQQDLKTIVHNNGELQDKRAKALLQAIRIDPDLPKLMERNWPAWQIEFIRILEKANGDFAEAWQTAFHKIIEERRKEDNVERELSTLVARMPVARPRSDREGNPVISDGRTPDNDDTELEDEARVEASMKKKLKKKRSAS